MYQAVLRVKYEASLRTLLSFEVKYEAALRDAASQSNRDCGGVDTRRQPVTAPQVPSEPADELEEMEFFPEEARPIPC